MPSDIYDTYNDRQMLLFPGDDPTDTPGIHIGSDALVAYTPEGRGSIMLSKDNGVSIAGGLSLQTSPSQFRFAGLWKTNAVVTTCLPSTTYTPVPWLRQSMPKPPTKLVEGMVAVMALMAGIV